MGVELSNCLGEPDDPTAKKIRILRTARTFMTTDMTNGVHVIDRSTTGLIFTPTALPAARPGRPQNDPRSA